MVARGDPDNWRPPFRKSHYRCLKDTFQAFRKHHNRPLKKKKIGLHSSAVTGVVPDGVACTVQALLRHHFQAHQ